MHELLAIHLAMQLLLFLKTSNMNVLINNVQQLLPDDATVSLVLQTLQIVSDKGVAFAINNTVIPRSDWQTCSISEGDKITLIKATQGG